MANLTHRRSRPGETVMNAIAFAWLGRAMWRVWRGRAPWRPATRR
jgi:hypothetical protein